jgi:hypothetical protein
VKRLTRPGLRPIISSEEKIKIQNSKEIKKMSATETVKSVLRGLMVRTFGGEIDKTPEEKDKTKKTIIKFNYDRIVFPWSRTGEDSDGNKVTGSVPSLAEVMAWTQAQGFSTEFVLDSEGQPTKSSVVGFLVDGINQYLNQTSRAKALNTKETAQADAIRLFAKRMGISVEQATDQLKAMFA